MANDPAKSPGYPTPTEAAYGYPKDFPPGVNIPEPGNYPKAPSGGFGDSSNYSAGRPPEDMAQNAPGRGQPCEQVATQRQLLAEVQAKYGAAWPDTAK